MCDCSKRVIAVLECIKPTEGCGHRKKEHSNELIVEGAWWQPVIVFKYQISLALTSAG